MRYLHTMVRVRDIEDSKRFYCDGLGLKETRRYENEGGRFTLVFLAPEGQEECPIELTYNWDPEDYQGCLLYTSPSPRDLSTSRMPSSA